METPWLSFIICSWQAPPTLDETLDSIARESPSHDIETVLVNNGFTPDRATELQRKHPALRLVDETTPGLAHARRTGFRTARGEFFVCLDDDNLIGPGFINALKKLTGREPRLGCVCPVVVPLWEIKPEPWLQEFGKSCLSYNSPCTPAASSNPREKIWKHPNLDGWPSPSGGGMIIHRALAEDYLRETHEDRLALGRVGNKLGASEDQDIIYRINRLGWDAAWSGQLLVYHKIPAARTRMSYLLKLNWKMMQDAALFESIFRRGDPLRSWNSLPNHLALPFWKFLAWIRGRIPARLLLLEWTRSAGFIWGWLKVTLRA
jgi:glycosyltransferase involved in cell wall biosynthesis